VPPANKETAADPSKKYRNSGTEENSEFDGSLSPVIDEALKK